MSEKIRLAVIDDHPIFLSGLRRALDAATDIIIVAEGGTADDALRIALEDKPNVMLLDISMPGNGISAVAEISRLAPDVKVIMLTASLANEHITRAMSLGAKGYVPKGEGAKELRHSIRSVHAGQTYVNQPLAAEVLKRRATPEAQSEQDDRAARLAQLRGREIEVLNLAARGLSNKEIAEELGLQVATVKFYMSRVLSKLRVHNRIGAIRLVEDKS